MDGPCSARGPWGICIKNERSQILPLRALWLEKVDTCCFVSKHKVLRLGGLKSVGPDRPPRGTVGLIYESIGYISG